MKPAEFYKNLTDFRLFSEPRESYIQTVDDIAVREIQYRTSAISMLDIGAADGVRGLKIAKLTGVKSLTFVEPSEQMIQQINKLSIPNYLNFKVYQGTAEKLNDIIRDEKFDVITMLWNVLGHVPNFESRVDALSEIRKHLKPDGILIFDINNRYNFGAYGKQVVLKNFKTDKENPSGIFEENGDIFYQMKVDGQEFPAWGHVFNLREVLELINLAGLGVLQRFTIDYQTGEFVKSVYRGQLVFVCNSTNANTPPACGS